MRKWIQVLMASTVLGIALCTPAQAHRQVSDDWAMNAVYNRYNHECGTMAWGWTWCWRRVVTLSAQPVGDHSWRVRYTWNEAKPGTLYACGYDIDVYTHTGAMTVIKRGCIA